MKKKLVFHFFIAKNWRDNPVYKIHFNCLSYYRSCFDEAYFALSLEDPNDLDSLYEVKQKLLDIFRGLSKIEFENVENTILCECPTFKKQIADKLGEDDLVFFAHLKGTMNIKEFDSNWVYNWICGLYYFSLNEEYESNNKFITRVFTNSEHYLSYGSYRLKFYLDQTTFNKYEWYYCGTFFWINSKRLKEYIKLNNIELPIMSDRFYAETFLGNIYNLQTFPVYAGAYRIKNSEYQFLEYCKPVDIEVIDYYTDILLNTPEEKENFKNYLTKMKTI